VLWDFRERGNINSKLSMIYGAEAESNHRHEDFQ